MTWSPSPLRTLLVVIPALALCAYSAAASTDVQSAAAQDKAPAARAADEKKSMHVHYLEIITPDVEETCAGLAKLHGVTFGEPVPALGNAHTAPLKGGGRIGVRAPMHGAEEPATRPYVLVEDIEAATKEAQAAGAKFMVTAMEIPGQGRCAIYTHGGLQYGLWEL